MQAISLAVITHNSEKILADCLRSVQGLVSEIVLVDEHSSDKSRAIAQEFNAKVAAKKLESCALQKKYALDQAACPWIFLLDSDETCTSELAEEIKKKVENSDNVSAYRIPRKNIYFGKWLKYGGKYPDYQVRLYKKGAARYSEHFSHEKVMVNGPTGTLNCAIEHHAYPDIDTWFMKLKRTAEFDAMEMERSGLRPSFLNHVRFCALRPVIRFDRRYFLKGGFLDGIPGLLACLHDALTQILAYFIFSRKFAAKNSPKVSQLA